MTATATYPGRCVERYRRPDVHGEAALCMVERPGHYVVLAYHAGDEATEDDLPDVHRCATIEEARSKWKELRGGLVRRGFRRV